MSTSEFAVLGNGCFWCTEAVYQRLKGVLAVMPGYAGGELENPTYEQVCTGKTGHAEMARIEFDPSQISYQDLLQVFFFTHDPTSLDRQGNDVGPQYRSVILYASEQQKQQAEQTLQELDASGVFEKPIVTEIKPFTTFFAAEEYHRDYFTNHPMQPYCMAVISPKLKKFQEKYHSLLK